MSDAHGAAAASTIHSVSTSRSSTLPGCSFGVGIGSGARDDTRSVLTVWLVTSLSWAVLPVAVLAWFARRSLVDAAAHLMDRRQRHAVDAYLRQFAGCEFASVGLDEVAPRLVADAVRRSAAALRTGGDPLIRYVVGAKKGAILPGAFTTFFFLRSPPLIICPRDPRSAVGYHRFILYHELGHAAGFQTSHSSGRMAAIADAGIIGSCFAVLGIDHVWGWAALGGYSALRLVEISRAPSSSSAESHADIWGLWGIEVEGGDVARTLHLHRVFLAKLDPAVLDARLEYVRDWRRDELGQAAKRNAEMHGTAGPDGVLRVEVEQNAVADFSEAFGRIENIQLGGPGGLDHLRFASMIVTGLPLAILLGVALAAVHVEDARFTCLAASLSVITFASRLIRPYRSKSTFLQ